VSSSRSRIVDWLDERTGARDIVRSQLTGYLIPGLVNRWYSLGFVLLLFVAIQFGSGILLLAKYVGDPMHAFESVQWISNEVPYGWFIRLVHAHGANAMVILLLMHMLTVVVFSAYKRPRELHWITGCLLLFVTLGLCFTGYILPWSQLSYWATTIGMNIVGAVPLVGPTVQEYFQGGDIVGPYTLGRAVAFHVALLPMALGAIVALHLYLVRFSGISMPPLRRPRDRGAAHANEQLRQETKRFFPDFLLEDLAVALGVLAVFCAVLFFAPHLYFTPDAFEKADPTVTPSHVKPEWYFLASYQVLRMIPDKTIGIAIQGIAIALLVALPFIDRSEKRHILERPVFLAGVCIVVLSLIVLTFLGARA
jgi:quinol-cytochrome oxidoreductase complex cytochrome b subunit